MLCVCSSISKAILESKLSHTSASNACPSYATWSKNLELSPQANHILNTSLVVFTQQSLSQSWLLNLTTTKQHEMKPEVVDTSVACFDMDDLIGKIDEFQHGFRAEMALLHKIERGPDYLQNLTSYTEHAHNLGKHVVPNNVLTKYLQATANLIPGRLHVSPSPDFTTADGKVRGRERILSDHETSHTAVPTCAQSMTLIEGKAPDTLSDASVISENTNSTTKTTRTTRPRLMTLTTSELLELFEHRSADPQNSKGSNLPQSAVVGRTSRRSQGSCNGIRQTYGSASSSSGSLLEPLVGRLDISEVVPQEASCSVELRTADNQDNKATLKVTSSISSASLDIWQKEALNPLSEVCSQGSSDSQDVWLQEARSPLLSSGSPTPSSQYARVHQVSKLSLRRLSQDSTNPLNLRIENLSDDEGDKTPTPKSVLARNSRASLKALRGQGSTQRLKSRPSGMLRSSSGQSLRSTCRYSLQSETSSTSRLDIWMKIADET